VADQGGIRREVRALAFVDSRTYRRPTRLARRGKQSGSGSARLDLSQKGDLPSSGEWTVFIWSKVADARKRPE
jgi:hypothetical protein